MESTSPESNQTIAVPADHEEKRAVLLPGGDAPAGVDNIDNNSLGHTTAENARTGSEHSSRAPESVSFITDSDSAKPALLVPDEPTGE